MRRLFPLAAALAVIAALVWAFLPRPVEVELAEVALRPLEVTVEEVGEARIREVFTVSANIAGRLQRISLHAGDAVREGDRVAAIGPAAPVLLDSRSRAVAEATAAAAAAATELARAQLAQAEATRDFMTAEAARATALIRKGALSERAYDNAVREEKTAQAAVASALANLAVREKELESAQVVLSLDRTGPSTACCVEILAPVSGRVLRVLTESEQAVQPGTPILELGDPGNLEIVVELLSRDAVRVAEGARATASGWGGAPIAARVERVEPAAVTRVSALGIEEQRVTVILALEGVPADWKQLGHGFRVTARIAIWQQDGVLAIPVGALFRDGQDWASYILRDGRVALRRITLGERNEAFAQVLDGLQAGDQVILHPSDQVADGVRAVAVPGG
ncbi:MAG: HlyD family efflux transporter periplasmic adaptor subunit [Tabrizicola sp.]|nr:HlyD family efflux transporter periplasmic adaptor subunit [Tabrizicola sp.]